MQKQFCSVKTTLAYITYKNNPAKQTGNVGEQNNTGGANNKSKFLRQRWRGREEKCAPAEQKKNVGTSEILILSTYRVRKNGSAVQSALVSIIISSINRVK